MRLKFTLAYLLISAYAFAEPIGPALNPAVTQATIAETICTTGWMPSPPIESVFRNQMHFRPRSPEVLA